MLDKKSSKNYILSVSIHVFLLPERGLYPLGDWGSIVRVYIVYIFYFLKKLIGQNQNFLMYYHLLASVAHLGTLIFRVEY